MGMRALALWFAVTAVACAAAYTVDCNHEYTDCDNELSKLAGDDEDIQPSTVAQSLLSMKESSTPGLQTISVAEPTTPKITTTNVPSTSEFFIENSTESTKPKPRLINLSIDELQSFAKALHNQTDEIQPRKHVSDLSDVNLDEEDDAQKMMEKEDIKGNEKISDKFFSNLHEPFNPLLPIDRGSDELEGNCKENGISYKTGEKIERGCEETCECVPGGIFDCTPRCKHPYIRRGRRLNDPLCFESPVDECCSIIACATGNSGEIKSPGSKIDMCRYGNDSYPMGAKWNIGCEQICSCEPKNVVTCKPRCEPLPQSDKCINVQDPNDICCQVQVCDVSQDVHEEPLDNITSTTSSTTTEKYQLSQEDDDIFEDIKTSMRPLVLAEPIGSVRVLQNNSVQVNLIHLNKTEDPIHLLLSSDGGRTFQDVELKYSNLILNLKGGKDYVLKTKETGTKFNFTITAMDTDVNEVPTEDSNATKIGCYNDGVFYAVGEEFHIGCEELCECTGKDTRECAALQCPNHVGLELVSRGCVHWAPSPPPQPPNCCPRSARCLSDGTCHYDGHAVPNWSEVPISLTGCERRCFCENGELDCQDVCTALPPVPPQNFRCPPLHRPMPVNVSDEDCCKQWGCVPNAGATALPGISTSKPQPHQPPFLPTIPPGINYPQEDIPDYDQNNIHRPENHPLEPVLPTVPVLPPRPPGYGEENKKLSVISLQADSPTSVKMLFGLPPVLVGLRGSVDLRYTDKTDEDISRWYSQVFAPADEVLSTSRLEFRLTGLKPSTLYRVRGKLYLHNLPVEPESDVYTVRTLDLPTMEEKRREIDSRLTVVDVNDTSALVTWRHFTEEELTFIDGIQVRYRPVGTPIYLMTELLHHSRSNAELHDLRPGSKYEASLVLVPPPRNAVELHDPASIQFTTAPYVDPYNWSVVVEARAVGSESAELTWRGVPSPAERWVRVYRAAHECGSGRAQEHDEFRLAARDQPPAIKLSGLEPNTKCRVWLELFLTNGKVKTSNVLEVNTKSLDEPEPIDNVIEASSVGSRGGASRGDYYGALVVVGVIAALGALTSLLLLLIVVRRHRPRSVPITPVPSAPRESSLPPYDNPAYKLELQQETMDL